MSLTITPTFEQVQIIQNRNNVIQVSAQGPVGPGVPTGGIAGQYLRKQSAADYDATWANIVIGEVTGLSAALAALQPLNASLTQISGLTFAANDLIQYVGGVLTNRTPAQVKASLAIATGDVSGLGTMATQNANAVAITGGTIAVTSVAVGTNPAQTGSFRAANNSAIYFRNTANSADIRALLVDNTDTILFGAASANTPIKIIASTGAIYVTSTAIYLNNEQNAVNIQSYWDTGTAQFIEGSTGRAWFGTTDTFGFGQVNILTNLSTRIALAIKGASSQTANLTQWQDNSDNIVSFIAASGAATFGRLDSGTNDTQTALTVRRNSSNTPAANFASSVVFQLKTSTTNDQNAASIVTSLVVATHASYTTRQVHNIYDAGGAREAFRIEASGSAPMIGFLGAAAVVRQAMGAWAGLTDAQRITALRDALTNLGLTSYT